MSAANLLTRAMKRELAAINLTGEPSDQAEWYAAGPLWFHARDRVIGALLRRGLIVSGEARDYELTDAGRAALGPNWDAI